jgi:predicted TIM-barrel fold metal-dependent hydrolase
MIIDAHVHILPDRVRDNLDSICGSDPWFGACHAGPRARVASAEDLVAAMDQAGIDAAVCFTWPFADPALCAEGNDYVAAAVRRHPGRIIGFGCVQPADPRSSGREVARCARLGLRGLGELNADAQGWSLGDAAVTAPLAAAAAAASLPLTLHCSEPVGHSYPGKGTATPGRVAGFVERHPELRVICAHLGGGLPFYAHMPEVRELCRRLWFDTAAVPMLYRDSAYRAVVELCGADRLLFGSDHPLLDPRRYLPDLASLGLSPADHAAVLGGNAAGLLGL